MVVRDFDVFRTLFRPAETEAVLLVDSYAVLPFPIASKGFQAVSGRAFQVIKIGGGVKDK